MGSYSGSQQGFESIISGLTVEEKATLLSGADFWTTSPVTRVGIPALKVSDGPNGARGGHFQGKTTSACFPASVSLAASFDREFAYKIGRALGQETKTKGAHVLLGPTVCHHRDPRGGRNFESFSEDPLLAGELASEWIAGLQSEGVGATVKHYAVNEQETRRFTIDARVDQRALREIYLKPFEIAVKRADPWAIMTSYNLVNGKHADEHKELITDILRGQWGFKGLVMSDWGGTNSVAPSLNAGHDLEMPGPPLKRTVDNIQRALQTGELTEDTLNQRVGNVLKLLQRAGKFENPEIAEEQAVDLPEHRSLIRQAAAESMVLLKNTNNILPLKSTNTKSIALLGLAREYLGHGGGSASVNSHHKVTAYEALQAAVGSSVQLNYAEGARIVRNLSPLSENVYNEEGVPGFTMKTFSKLNGDNPTVSTVPSSVYRTLEPSSIDQMTLLGTFKPKTSGLHYISLSTLGGTRVYINDELVFDYSNSQTTDIMAFLIGSPGEDKKRYLFTAGESYRIRIEAKATKDTISGFSLFTKEAIGFSLGFALESEHDADLLTAAIEAAKSSDVAVVFVGHTPIWESEGADRSGMDLPKDGSLDALVVAAAKVNPNTVVVNSTGSAISMPWIEDVAAVVQAWFPGQEAGHSIADVLLGKVTPSGKLPVTFPRAITDVPSYENFPGDIKNEVVHYKESIYTGYRHFDRRPEGVLFPFGFGLSYTTFDVVVTSVSRTKLRNHETLTVSADVTNTGTTEGAEVVQVYVGAGEGTSAIDRPAKELAGFAKVHLRPGEARKVAITFGRDSVAYWNESRDKWSVDKGAYTIYVGTSSVDIAGKLEVEVPEAFDFDP
ncbi:hypothetical protein PV08_06767 [Exophiala spinifera]|uniref:beta-glucosidase n=1 Tax=Exophiala spinifera TaxID=91928 RepID=A0A0D1YG50_9EURO|nr:uncharacterized protein PV08_06767 [Exophiala spinifera]KIW13986.1 hypothetical protein PV08_06767 [Exophiala spinifera]